MITPMPLSGIAGSVSPICSSVSPQPLIAVSGVRSSWEMVEMKSFFILSAVESLAAMSFIVLQSSPISSL